MNRQTSWLLFVLGLVALCHAQTEDYDDSVEEFDDDSEKTPKVTVWDDSSDEDNDEDYSSELSNRIGDNSGGEKNDVLEETEAKQSNKNQTTNSSQDNLSNQNVLNQTNTNKTLQSQNQVNQTVPNQINQTNQTQVNSGNTNSAVQTQYPNTTNSSNEINYGTSNLNVSQIDITIQHDDVQDDFPTQDKQETILNIEGHISTSPAGSNKKFYHNLNPLNLLRPITSKISKIGGYLSIHHGGGHPWTNYENYGTGNGWVPSQVWHKVHKGYLNSVYGSIYGFGQLVPEYPYAYRNL